MTTKIPMPSSEDPDLLLPWLATGRLEGREAARLAEVVERDPERARHYELVRDELSETIRLNEDLGAPSGRASAQLFKLIDAEGGRPMPAAHGMAKLSGWFSGRAASLRPAPRLWLAAAAVIIVAQGAVLTTVVSRNGSGAGTYQTASGPQVGLGPGSFALVSFAPDATAAQITRLLEKTGASVVRGPSGGLFTIRLSDRALPLEEIERSLAKLRENSSLVLFAAPTQP